MSTNTRDNTAIICKKQPGITFGELNAACNALAAGLNRLGMSKGDTIAVCLGNSYHTRQMFWTAAKGGFVVALINTRLNPKEAAYIINDSEAACLIVSREFQQKIEEIRDELKTVRHFIGVDPDMPGFLDLEDIIASAPANEIECDLQEDDLLWLQYTSGTTGFPERRHVHPTVGCRLRSNGTGSLEGLWQISRGNPLSPGGPLLCAFRFGLGFDDSDQRCLGDYHGPV